MKFDWALSLLVLCIIVVFGLIIGTVISDLLNQGFTKLPDSVMVDDIAYKTNAAVDHETRYYFITTDGERLRVTRHLYDSYTQIPTEIPAGCK